MGEVYRADDLELNQSVALKFLPEKVARSADDLAHLRREVRIARQIAHPNVCRTYDIAEADGQVFVVMEYVDGEDLASVLRRLGRPTPDKALEIARQLCLGLGAAHENGVLHRDLKPANIMIDGRGRVRITDFGLAGTAEELAAEGGGSGTPGYMAPEQEASGGATIQSDIYSLGLVLYEVFTGRRASEMVLAPDPTRPGSEGGVRTPSSLVADMDPAVERAILRCLARDPARRMQSAYAVFGALPGGDPLAAAVAAGETPSPELVANAGGEGTMKPLHAALAIVAVVAALAAVSSVQRPLYEGFGLHVKVLTARAEEILVQAMGQSPPRFSAHGYRYGADSDSAKQFWRRWSPAPFVPTDIHITRPIIDEPPQAYPGSATLVMGTDGRLLGLTSAPSRPDSARDAPAMRAGRWDAVLRATGHDPALAVPIVPPRDFAATADTISAWAVSRDSLADTTIVAASFRGRIVDVETRVRGRSVASVEASPPESLVSSSDWVWFLIVGVVPFFGSIILAWRNLRSGRGDVRGAIFIGIVVGLLYHPQYIVSVNLHEMGFLLLLASMMDQVPAGHALIHGVRMAISYLAIEPYVRRFWPNVLVGWARVVAGRWRDPRVGRDILVGAATGAFMYVVVRSYSYISRNVGIVTEPMKIDRLGLPLVMEPQAVLGAVSVMLAVAAVQTMSIYTMLVIFRYVLRSSRAAVIAVTIILFLFLWFGVETGLRPTLLSIPFNLVFSLAAVFVGLRYGFVASVAMFLFFQIADGLPWTSDLGAWFAPQIEFSWGIVAVILAAAFFTAVGGKSILRDPLGEPVGRAR